MDKEQKIVRVCESVLRNIYSAGKDLDIALDKPTDKFEKCGAMSQPDPILTPIDPNDFSKGFVQTTEDE